jgi:hypothetical protein
MTNISEAGWIGIGTAMVLVIGASIFFKGNKSSETSSINDWIDKSVNDTSILSQFPRIEGGRKKSNKQKKNIRNNSKKRR